MILDQLIALYNRFLLLFPPYLHFWVSLFIFIALVIWLLDLIKRHWLWVLLLVLFIPASIPLLKKMGETVLGILQFLLSR